MTIHTHAAINTPGMPHDWVVLLMVLVQMVHHAGRLRDGAAGWVAACGVL